MSVNIKLYKNLFTSHLWVKNVESITYSVQTKTDNT